MAYLPAHVFHASKERRSQIQSDAGIDEAFHLEDNDGRSTLRQLRRPSTPRKQQCSLFFPTVRSEDDEAIVGNCVECQTEGPERHGNVTFCISNVRRRSLQWQILLASDGISNPCYRRES
jgi:hypothetical protein